MVRSSKDERQTRDEFGSRYSLGTADVLLEMERVVLGGDWGANGYVTSSFLETARSWRSEFSRREVDIKQLIGEKEWEERQSNRIGLVRAIEKGSLRRLLVTGGTA